MAWGYWLLRACLSISGTKTGSVNVGRRRLTGPGGCRLLAPACANAEFSLKPSKGGSEVHFAAIADFGAGKLSP